MCPVEVPGTPCPDAPVEHRTLRIFRAGTGHVVATTRTDGDGLFSFDLPPGVYDIRPDLENAESVSVPAEGVDVIAGRTTNVRIVIDTGIRGAQAGSPTPSPPGVITLSAVGDVALARELAERIDTYGPAYPFELVRDLYASADVSFANLEGVIGLRGAPVQKSYVFRNPPAHVRALIEGGVDIVSLANNHTLDYGPDGLIDTMLTASANGIAHVGAAVDEPAAYAPALLDVGGVRLALLAYANVPPEAAFDTRQLAAGPDKPGVAWATEQAIRRDVAAVRQRADHVIVSFHFGDEYRTAPNALQVSLARAAIDAGASVVLGHHPHVLQGIETYRGGIIAYSLGNFVFDLDETDLANMGPQPILSMILTVRLSKTAVLGHDTTPVVLDPATDRPRPADAGEQQLFRERLQELAALIPPP
jgi:poly-gamma-glutamate capsule biosynthesis protein CapA/YwtB (metallophosphatase superfamily)